MDIANQLILLEQIKLDIKQALKDRGVIVDDSLPFRNYASLIHEINDYNNLESIVDVILGEEVWI